MPENKRKKALRLYKLQQAGGTDKELTILSEIMNLEDDFQAKIDQITQDFKDSVKDIKNNVPSLESLIGSIKGFTGPQGVKGEKGDKGGQGNSITGPQGEKGDTGERGPQGFRGETGFDGKDGESITGPAGIDGTNGSSDTPEEIVSKLTSLEEPWLEQSAIKGLGEIETRSKSYMDDQLSRVTARSSNSMKITDLSTQTNGTLKVFSVPKGVAGFVVGSDFPTILLEGNGFTLNKTRTQLTLTVTNAPSSGSQLAYIYSSFFN